MSGTNDTELLNCLNARVICRGSEHVPLVQTTHLDVV